MANNQKLYNERHEMVLKRLQAIENKLDSLNIWRTKVVTAASLLGAVASLLMRKFGIL